MEATIRNQYWPELGDFLITNFMYFTSSQRVCSLPLRYSFKLRDTPRAWCLIENRGLAIFTGSTSVTPYWETLYRRAQIPINRPGLGEDVSPAVLP